MSQLVASLADLYAPIRDDLVASMGLFDAEIASDLPFLNNLCETVRSYRGKMLRPALLLLSGRALGPIRPAHRTLAAVVEMVHMATLVHDDVLDEAAERRRQPTVGRVAGNAAAVLVGDFLISHAFHLCSSLESQHASRRIGAATNQVCEGELLQNHHAGRADLSEETYFEIVRRKTGVLTAVSCELGAYAADADDEVVERLREFGMTAGVAFQIVDDVLDLVGSESVVGKTLGRDAALGKLTLPTIHALAHAPASQNRELRQALFPSGRDVAGSAGTLHSTENLRAILEAAGSLDYALRVAGDYVARARFCLTCLPEGEARSSLDAMAGFILQRSF